MGLGSYCRNDFPDSRAREVLGIAGDRLDLLLKGFFLAFGKAWKGSALARGVALLNPEAWFSASAFTKLGRKYAPLLLAPKCGTLTEGTALGIILVAGAFVPTGLQALLFVGFVFALLYKRATACEESPIFAALPFRLALPFVALFLFLAGATVSSVVPGQSLKSFFLWSINGMVFLWSFDAASKGREDSVVWPVLTGVAVSGMVGIYQHLSGWQPPRSWLDAKFEDDIVRIVGTFANPNYLAEMVGLALPLALALFIKNRNLRDKGLLFGVSFLQGAALVLTWSRGAWLGFLGSLAVLAVLFDKRLLVAGMVLALIVGLLAPPVIVQRLLSSFTVDDSSNSYRVSIWRGSLSLLKAFFFRGVGLGAAAFKEMYPEYMIIETPAFHSHSIYIEMSIELGFFGFLVLMWFLGASLWCPLSFIFSQKGTDIMGRWTRIAVPAGCVAAVAGHMIQGIIDHTWYNPQIMLLVWAWLGLAAGVGVSMRAPLVSTGREEKLAP